MVQQCLGVVHTMLWNTAIWVFEDCLKLVQEPSEGLQVHTIKLEEKLPQGECLLGGHIHIFGQSSLKVLLTFSSGGKEFPFTEIFVLLSRTTRGDWAATTQTIRPDFGSHTFWRFCLDPTRPAYEGIIGKVSEFIRPKSLWSTILPGWKVRCFELCGDFLESMTFDLERRRWDTFFAKTPKTRRFQHDFLQPELLDVHPTNANMVILRVTGNRPKSLFEGVRHYVVVAMLPAGGWEILAESVQMPIWTRLGYRFSPSPNRHLFEFWNGSLFELWEGEPDLA